MESTIELWVTYYRTIRDGRILAAYRELLSPLELWQERQFVSADARLQFLVSRAALRTALTGYCDNRLAPDEWRFSIGRYGKPEISNRQVVRTPSFNLSHTAGVILLGLTNCGSLGLDVETIDCASDPLNAMRQSVFAARIQRLADFPTGQQLSRFFEYWTLKESYIKALGKGLTIPMNDLLVDFPTDTLITLRTKDAGRWRYETHWRLWQFELPSGAICAVCNERTAAEHVRFRTFECVPMVCKTSANFRLLRTSA